MYYKPIHYIWKNPNNVLKVDVPILPCVFYTFNWLTLTSEMYFVRFHPEVTSCLLSRGKTKYATLGMRLWCKYIRNYLLVYQLILHFLPYLRNYKEFEGEISDLQLEKYGLSFETKKYTSSGWARGDENVISIRAFKTNRRQYHPWFDFFKFWTRSLLWQFQIYHMQAVLFYIGR